MTREEKCQLAIEQGYCYNQETGIITGLKNKKIGYKHNLGYVKFDIYNNNNKYSLFAHQFAWYWVKKECVDCLDHINGLKDDNRISNLRSVTHKQNHMNRTTAKGYCWSKKANKWQAEITLNYKKMRLGLFDKEEDARNAYLEAKKIYHII